VSYESIHRVRSALFRWSHLAATTWDEADHVDVDWSGRARLYRLFLLQPNLAHCVL